MTKKCPAMTERVRGDGGEEGKRVPTIFFLEEETFSLFATAWQVANFLAHLAGKRPISRQVELFLAHLTGLAGP